jgi:hypothetical protein
MVVDRVGGVRPYASTARVMQRTVQNWLAGTVPNKRKQFVIGQLHAAHATPVEAQKVFIELENMVADLHQQVIDLGLDEVPKKVLQHTAQDFRTARYWKENYRYDARKKLCM